MAGEVMAGRQHRVRTAVTGSRLVRHQAGHQELGAQDSRPIASLVRPQGTGRPRSPRVKDSARTGSDRVVLTERT